MSQLFLLFLSCHQRRLWKHSKHLFGVDVDWIVQMFLEYTHLRLRKVFSIFYRRTFRFTFARLFSELKRRAII